MPTPTATPAPEVEGASFTATTFALIEGGVVELEYTFTNNGTQTLGDLKIEDSLAESARCPNRDLEPGASITCTASYEVPIASPSVIIFDTSYQASDETGLTLVATTSVDLIVRDFGALTLDATIDDDPVALGDAIEITYTVNNTGTLSLSGVRVADLIVDDITCDSMSIEPGSSATCVGTLQITMEQVATGVVQLHSVVTGTADGDALSEGFHEQLPIEVSLLRLRMLLSPGPGF